MCYEFTFRAWPRYGVLKLRVLPPRFSFPDSLVFGDLSVGFEGLGS